MLAQILLARARNVGSSHVIRIRIVHKPPIAGIDGIQLDCFEIGEEYTVGTTIASLLLAEGWAEPVAVDAPERPTPFTPADPYDARNLYPPLPARVLTGTAAATPHRPSRDGSRPRGRKGR